MTSAIREEVERSGEDAEVRRVARGSAEGRALVARAHRLQDCADRAFGRYVNGEVRSASGAAALASRAAEAWAEVRIRVRGGEMVEAGWSEEDIAAVEEAQS